jgi:hypothetical protein
MADDSLIQAIKSQIGDGASEEQIDNVLAALQNVQEGDPVGTVRREDTGRVAHRVDSTGVVMWRVSGPDGEQYNDMQPTLTWPVIYEP